MNVGISTSCSYAGKLFSPLGRRVSTLAFARWAVALMLLLPAPLTSWSQESAAASDANHIPVGFGPYRDMLLANQQGDAFQVTLRKGHPHVWTKVLPATYDPNQHSVFAFEYFAPMGLRSVVLRYRVEDGSMAVAGSSTVGFAEAWQPIVFDLSRLKPPPAANHPEMRFHLAFDGVEATEFQIRGVQVRSPNAEERRVATDQLHLESIRQSEAEAILADLRAEYLGKIDTVHVSADTITISGRADVDVRIVGIAPHLRSFEANADPDVAGKTVANVAAPVDSRFSITTERVVANVDRATWRWRLADRDGKWVSNASWPTRYEPGLARNLPLLTSPNRKGIGGVPHIDRDDHPLFELGVSHATLNVVLNALIRTEPAGGWEPWVFEGTTFYINTPHLRHHDATLRHLAANNVIVSAILLVGNGRHANGQPHSHLTHPEAEVRGIYSMPNLTDEASTRFYKAALTLMAQRWSREDNANGRISNWIMHNEVDQAGTWTNMGGQPLARYVESYMRSARLMHHISRLYDPHSRVFVSLTHHWTKQSSGTGTYVVRDLLQLFAEMARAEGDFAWGVAYHPYPRDLRNPNTWNDADVTDDFDTPYITPKNIQVLPAYLNQPFYQYDGKVRGILLSEQGFNSPTLSETDQWRQAAGLIYMFRKLRDVDGIEAYHLHRYQDMPDAEGGLRLGVLTETGQRKVAWDVYRAIGTPQEQDYDEMADRVIRQTSQ